MISKVGACKEQLIQEDEQSTSPRTAKNLIELKNCVQQGQDAQSAEKVETDSLTNRGNRMTNAQSKTLIVVAIIFAVNLLILPWVHTRRHTSRGMYPEKSAGYAFFFAPPEPERSSYLFGVSIDTGRLIIQCLLILVVGGTAFGIVTVKGRKPDSGDRRSKDESVKTGG